VQKGASSTSDRLCFAAARRASSASLLHCRSCKFFLLPRLFGADLQEKKTNRTRERARVHSTWWCPWGHGRPPRRRPFHFRQASA